MDKILDQLKDVQRLVEKMVEFKVNRNIKFFQPVKDVSRETFLENLNQNLLKAITLIENSTTLEKTYVQHP